MVPFITTMIVSTPAGDHTRHNSPYSEHQAPSTMKAPVGGRVGGGVGGGAGGVGLPLIQVPEHDPSQLALDALQYSSPWQPLGACHVQQPPSPPSFVGGGVVGDVVGVGGGVVVGAGAAVGCVVAMVMSAQFQNSSG